MSDAKRFVKLNYKAYIADDGESLYSTTYEDAAKDAGVFDESCVYQPVPYIVGSKGLYEIVDKAIAEAEVGKEVEVAVPCEEAAGPRNPRLIELHTVKDFLKQDIQPYPGLEVTVKNRRGVITSVGSGRVKVDFNNQLAGHDLLYRFTVEEEITDPMEKAKAIVTLGLGSCDGFEFEVSDDKVVITEPEKCKFDSNWLLAKFKIVGGMREVFGIDHIEFVEIWDSSKKE